jgi:hypothetical protein
MILKYISQNHLKSVLGKFFRKVLTRSAN